MRAIAYPLVFALAFGATGVAQAASAPGQTLVDIEAKWSKAFMAHDTAYLDMVMAADWSGQNDADKAADKAGLIDLVKSGKLSITKMANHDVRARVFGDTAVVQGMDDETSTYDGKDTSGTYTWTDVFRMRGGRWVAVASQTTMVKK